MGWDVELNLGDMPLAELDVLFYTCSTCVVKVDRKEYPLPTLMNMCSYFNRMICKAIDIWLLKGLFDLLAWKLNINQHIVFAKT